jgi:nucleoside diphosphate kinase
VSERTLVLVKPDGVRRGLVGEVIGRLERKGLTLVAAELRTLAAETAREHYREHDGKPFFPGLVEFITGGPLMALVVEGHRAVEAVRPRLDPGRLRAGAGREPRPRLGLPGVRCPRDRAVLPRPSLGAWAQGG